METTQRGNSEITRSARDSESSMSSSVVCSTSRGRRPRVG